MAFTSGLGKGLASIIPMKRVQETDAGSGSGTCPGSESGKGSQPQTPPGALIIQEVSTRDVRENPHQPRTHFDHAALESLVDSIRVHGILQPLVVTQAPDGTYELIAGERRLRAARLLERPTVPVIVRQVTDAEKLELALIENIQREDLDPIERAQGYRSLTETFHLTQEDVAHRLGASRASVANTLRLLQLPPQVQEALRSGTITEGQGKVLLSLPSADEQIRYLDVVLRERLTVRQLEERTSGIRRRRHAKPIVPPQDIELRSREAALREFLGTKVSIDPHHSQVVIHYYSPEELRGIIDRILTS
ncbi:MAG: ParB/RepB/Spo0J family partition protein [Candidatus Kerfeldbacteria bacterium]|nr:ParB/RepB/Spo0J family partition protein [Candidatus Kerfeldbacteria bacterium]